MEEHTFGVSSIGGGALSPSKSQQLLPSRPVLSQPGLWLDVCGRRKGPLERLATSGTSLWSGRVLRLRLPPVEVSRAWGVGPEAGWGLPDSGGAVVLEASRPIPRGREDGGGSEGPYSCHHLPPGSQSSPQPAVLSKGKLP